MKLKVARAALVVAAALAGNTAFAQSAQDLVNDHKTPGDVLTYGMGYNQQRFSPLKQINTSTVKRLTPIWNFSTNNLNGDEAQAVVKDGVIFMTTSRQTFAIDALTGKQVWKHDLEFENDVLRVVCCGVVNRGAAIADGKVVRATLDGQVLALDAKTGKEVWKTKSVDYTDGFSYTGAPQIANGVVIVATSGAEYGIRGMIEGFDLTTGKALWKHYNTALPGEPGGDTWTGDSASHGGGSGWVTGSYDPELDLVYWGTGNPAPWDAAGRPGDNLFTNSVIALRPKTGERVWHYQFTPNDPYDYDGINEMVLADHPVDGKIRKVLMHADRNGFLYTIDRTNGQLISGQPFVKVTWADGIDMKTGRPIESAQTKMLREGKPGWEVSPAAIGGKNWFPMSYSPITKLLYMNTLNAAWTYSPVKVEYKRGQRFTGVAPKWNFPENRGTLKAIDPVTGKAKWAQDFKIPNWAGTMVTAGNVMFTGAQTGEFLAYDATTGKKLWQFQTGSGIVGQPITWEKDGKQYVTVASGLGGVYALRIGDERLANVPAGGSVWTFALQ
jgi:alcohol dehydrogenase (cytochrome c)